MSERILAQQEHTILSETEPVVYIPDEWVRWDDSTAGEFEKRYGVSLRFHNSGDVVYQNSQDFFYAKVPKPTSDGGIIQLTNELWGNFTYSSVGLSCPPRVFAAIDPSGAFRIASSFDLQFSDNLQTESSFSIKWSKHGLDQLKGNCIGRVYLHDTDVNPSNICFSHVTGLPCFVDFAHAGIGIHGDKFKAASSGIGIHDIDYYGWQFVNSQDDFAVKDFADKFSNFPLHKLEQYGRRILSQIICKLPLAKLQEKRLWENFDKTIQIHRFRRFNIKPWTYDNLLLKVTRKK